MEELDITCRHGIRIFGAFYCEICGAQLKQQCPSCGAIHDVRKRFCQFCGTAQSAKRPEGL